MDKGDEFATAGGYILVCGRPITSWSVPYTPNWGEQLAQRAGGREMLDLVLFGKLKVVSLIFPILIANSRFSRIGETVFDQSGARLLNLHDAALVVLLRS